MEINRIAITDNSGRWFNLNSAEKFENLTYWDGRNMISMATKEMGIFQNLYLTAGGVFVLCQWSQWQGMTTTYNVINDMDAVKWFTKQGFNNDDIPSILHKYIKDYEL